MDFCEFEASLVYWASSRTARATQIIPASKNKYKRTIRGNIKDSGTNPRDSKQQEERRREDAEKKQLSIKTVNTHPTTKKSQPWPSNTINK